MNKNNIKKLIVSIIFISFLVIFFLGVQNLKSRNYDDNISVVKHILRENNNDIIYDGDYIYSINRIDNKYIYKIYDLNGNKLYAIKSEKKLNLKKVKKRYYIVQDNKYHLFDIDNKEIISSKNMESLNEYLIKVDNKIMNIDNEILFKDVHTINSFSNDKYFNINNYYLVDKKGNEILNNIFVSDEIENKGITDYLIIKKENMYYTFFTNINKIIGDGFDTYKKGKAVYIRVGNEKYKIYKTGLRKKISTYNNQIDDKYFLEDDNIINNNKMFVTNRKNNNIGILVNNKFVKINKGILKSTKKIDSRYYNLKINDINYLYDIIDLKIIYKSRYNLNEILIFNNDYKVVKDKKNYILLDRNNKEVLKLNKQIVLENKKIKVGRVNKELYIYNLSKGKYYSADKIVINDRKYYYYKKNKKYIVSENFDKKYSSDEYLSYNDDNIIKFSKDNLEVYNLKIKKKYNYKLEKESRVINEFPFRNTILIQGKDYFEIIDTKINVIKYIKDREIFKYYYNNQNGKIIIITKMKNNKNEFKGSYIAE